MDVTAIAFYIVNEVAADMEYGFYSNLFLIWIWVCGLKMLLSWCMLLHGCLLWSALMVDYFWMMV